MSKTPTESNQKSTEHFSFTKKRGVLYVEAPGTTDSTLTTTTSSKRWKAFEPPYEGYSVRDAIADFFQPLSMTLRLWQQRWNTWRDRQLREF